MTLVAAFLGAAFFYRTLGPLSVAGHAMAAVLLLGGFGTFAVVRTPTSPNRPLRATLTVSTILALFMLSGLPWPWELATVQAWGPLVVGTCASIALATLPREKGWPRALRLLLTAYGAFVLIRTPRFIATITDSALYSEEALALSLALATALGASWVIAGWHGHSIRNPANRAAADSAAVAG